MVVGDIVRRNAKLNPCGSAIQLTDRTFTWRELEERVRRTAVALRNLGIERGQRVGVLAFNCHQYVELYLANGMLGSVTVPLNYRLTPAELEYIVNDSQAVTLIVGENLVPAVDAIRNLVPAVRRFVCIGATRDGYLNHEELLAAADPTEELPIPNETDLLWQMYTSGTTGRPKGAMLTHRALLTNVQQCLMEYPIGPTDCSLIVAPLYHAAASVNSFMTMSAGARQYILPMFEPLGVLDALQNRGVSHALLVPAMIQFLLTVPGIAEVGFPHLRNVIYGASAIPTEILRRAIETFGCNFVQGFGQTESTAVLTILRAEDHVLEGSPERVRRLQSCGREVFGCEVRVVDEQGNDVKPGEIGEVIARGDQLMQGYWNLPEATASTLRNGWLHTGDLATMDDEKFIFIVDRIKDMLVSGGENVYPREIEEILFTHPAIADAAVIGVPSKQWGEEVKAIVVLKPGASATAEEIMAHCGKTLAGYKRPRSVDFVAELPKNPSGKVLKRELREPYWKDHGRRVN